MFKFLALVFIVGIIGFLILGVFMGRVIRFFGPGNKNTSNRRQRSNNKKGNTTSENASLKKFPKEEGEYVNYEEIKEE